MATDPFLPDERASWTQRLLAWIIDTVVFVPAAFVGLLLLALANGGELRLQDGRFVATVALIGLLWDVAWIASPVRGKPGHRLLGLRIVRVDGARVTVMRAALRWLVRSTSYVTTGLVALGSAITIAVTPRRQAVHDLVAGTVAVSSAGLERVSGPLAYVPDSARRAVPVVQTQDERRQGPFL